MTLYDLIDRCRLELWDRVKPYLFSDEKFAMFLTEAEEEAAIRKQLLRVNDIEIDVTAGERIYDIDPSLYEIVYASLVYASAPTMLPWQIGLTTAAEMDMRAPMWRSIPFRPTGIIHNDTTIEVNCPPDSDYLLRIEGYRKPSKALTVDRMTAEPEINSVHHRYLVKWAVSRAFSVPQADITDPTRADKLMAEFDDYFGPRPDASNKRDLNANTPPMNQCIG